jgi:type VI secretion system protein ImpM
MTAIGIPPGFFGKFFTHGDFVDRRLPREFLTVWDAWLQGAMAASREQLGVDWLGAYLHSPIWRFGLSPGICGNTAWAGVLMPSVDKVGRHFPLTLAAALPDASVLPHLFSSKTGLAWFADLEQLALTGLQDEFDLNAFDQHLQTLYPPSFAPASLASQLATTNSDLKKVSLNFVMPELDQISNAFLEVSSLLMKRFMPSFSLWFSASEQKGATLTLLEGLPPIDSYSAMLSGNRTDYDWVAETIPIRSLNAGTSAVSTRLEADNQSQQATAPIRKKLQWRSFGRSVVGKKRALNEDAMLDRVNSGLWAVADGMGGHSAGDVASQAIIAALAKVEPANDGVEYANRVTHALQQVNSQLLRMAADSGEIGQVIGSTVVVLLTVESNCIFLWAGDSRLYRFRAGQLEQLTHDHSLFAEFARQGLLTEQQLISSGRCDTITRAIGSKESLILEQASCEAIPGDLYLLCSDGLDKELTHEDIAAVFRETQFEGIADLLIHKAEERGARDNVTVIVAGLFNDSP